jgi:hypothetical protein
LQIQFRAEPKITLTAKLVPKTYLASDDSGLQLDLEIALGGVSAKIQPCDLFGRAGGKLKRRMT